MRATLTLFALGSALLFPGCGAAPAHRPASPAATPVALAVPPPGAWQVTASEPPEEQFAPALATDGRADTRWSSPASDPQWLQIDLGREADLCGAAILWETAYSSAYTVQLSTDGEHWSDAYATEQGDGRTDDLYFAPARARYVRILGRKRATQWGHSIWEVSLKGPADQPIVRASSGDDPNLALLFDGRLDTAWQGPAEPTAGLEIDLRAARAFGGLRVDWGADFASNIIVSASDDGQQWREIGRAQDSEGVFDLVMVPRTEARFLRLVLEGPHRPGMVSVRELSLRGPDEPLSSLAQYRLAAAKAARGAYPLQLVDWQVYWTLLAVPGDRREGLFDEYGGLEPWQDASMLMPLLHYDGRLVSALDAKVTQRLADDALPLPGVRWDLPEGTLDVTAFAAGHVSNSAIYARYVISNTATGEWRGRLFLAARPLQVNPTWQHGGLSPIRELVFTSESNLATAVINGREQYVSLTPPQAMGARAFDGGDIARDLQHGRLPTTAGVTNNGELISGAFAYDFALAPASSCCVVVAAPLHRTRADIESFLAGAADGDLNAAFERRREALARAWRRAIHRVGFELPDAAVQDTVHSQLAYILGNMDGVAIQPGSRNYKRSWIRDGGVTSIALLRMGITEPVREFLDWYAARVQPDGLVPPIMNNDGSVNDGYGSEREYDSQGQFVHAVVEYYRLTGDRDFLARHFKAIELALRYLVQLREQTLAPGYLRDEPARERFGGILPPSYSHEGYNPPMHSYWDDFWALKGWKDGRDACEIMGRPDLARWCREQYDLLKESTRATLAATMAFKGIDFIPGCADKGDFDATSTAIALSPCGEIDTLPADALRRTFDRYVTDVRKRLEPGAEWVYTPYEARNISALVELGRRDDAVALLDFLLSCRRPAAWNHLAEVVVSEPRKGTYIGDMPHTWVGSDLVNAVRQMIVQEEGGRLALLKGAPERWVRDGQGVRVERLPTHFGPLTMSARQVDRSLTVRLDGTLHAPDGLDIFWPRAGKPIQVLCDGKPWPHVGEDRCRVPATTREIVATW